MVFYSEVFVLQRRSFYCFVIFCFFAVVFLNYKSSFELDVRSVAVPSPAPVLRESLRSRLRRSSPENPCDVWITQQDVRESIQEEARSFTNSETVIKTLAKEYVDKNEDFSTKPWDITKFDSSYKSPCWHDKTGRVRCLPAFYLAGFPKCGTTDLWKNLVLHKGILGDVHRKEPNWWGWRRIASDVLTINKNATAETKQKLKERNKKVGLGMKITMDEYFENFDKVRPDLLTGDASVDTVYNSNMFKLLTRSKWTRLPSRDLKRSINDYRILEAHLINQYTPDAKYVTILRDPGERAFSAYLFIYYYTHTKKRPTQEEFHKNMLNAINLYKKCLIQGGTLRLCGYSGTHRHQLMSPQIGQYVLYLTDLLKIIPRDNLLVVRFDDYRQSRAKVVRRIWEFLGLEKDDKLLSEMEKKEDDGLNSSKKNGQYIGPMWNKTRDLLRQYFRPFNLELSKLLNDDKFLFE